MMQLPSPHLAIVVIAIPSSSCSLSLSLMVIVFIPRAIARGGWGCCDGGDRHHLRRTLARRSHRVVGMLGHPCHP